MCSRSRERKTKPQANEIGFNQLPSLVGSLFSIGKRWMGLQRWMLIYVFKNETPSGALNSCWRWDQYELKIDPKGVDGRVLSAQLSHQQKNQISERSSQSWYQKQQTKLCRSKPSKNPPSFSDKNPRPQGPYVSPRTIGPSRPKIQDTQDANATKEARKRLSRTPFPWTKYQIISNQSVSSEPSSNQNPNAEKNNPTS